MGMIRFRAPTLPNPINDVDRTYIRQLIRSLELYFDQLDSRTPVQADSFTADKFIGGFFVESISPSITAAGTTQATATELTTAINNVVVVAAGVDGVRLPLAEPGVQILIRNSDASDTLSIYPDTGGQVNALGANNAFLLTAGSTVQLFANTTTQWFTF